MKKFIGAMIFGVIVVIYMVVEMNREQPIDDRPSPNARAVDDGQWSEPQQAEMRPANESQQSEMRSLEAYQAHTISEDEVELRGSAADDDYQTPQPGSLAELEELRDRGGRDVIDLALVPYQLEFEPVDYQWFREMEQALYSISYDVLETQGARMVHLECASSVCIADFEVQPGSELPTNAFFRASQEIDTFDPESLSMVFLSGDNGVVERIIFQRKE